MNQSVRNRLEPLFLGAEFAGPVPFEFITEAERRVGALFPPSYREFLAVYGAAFGTLPVEIYGIVHPPPDPNEPPQWIDVVEDTVRFRAIASIPQRYLAISHDGMDCAYFLDTGAAIAGEECPVVALGPGRDFEIVASSFLAFVELAAEGSPP